MPLSNRLAGVCLLLASSGAAQERPIAFLGARVVPIAAPAIEDGTVLVHRGKVVAVGPRAGVAVPAEAERREVKGVLLPGFVDTHSHIGGGSGGDASAPIQPDVRIWDTIDVRDPGLQKAQAGGITTVNVMPGSGHLLSGQTVYLKLRDGNAIEDLLIRGPDGAIAGGIKMANGTNSQRAAPFPNTRGKSAALVRTEFVKAQEYRAKVQRAGGDPEKLPPRDLRMEALAMALDGKWIVHHHTHRADDVLTVLRLAQEFGFRVVLHHVSEGWKVAEEIARAKAPCSVIAIDSPGGKLEAIHLRPETAGVLERAGVSVAIHSDDGITDSRLFLRSHAMAVRGGFSRAAALESLTVAGARMLDLQDRVGTIEPGKDADLVLLSGDPFALDTVVLETWVEGRKVFDRADPKDRLHAVGGLGASDGQVMHTHCGCCDGEEAHR